MATLPINSLVLFVSSSKIVNSRIEWISWTGIINDLFQTGSRVLNIVWVRKRVESSSTTQNGSDLPLISFALKSRAW
jgi:hypothetical protein